MSGSSFFVTAPPDVAIAVDAESVSAARLSWRGDVATVGAHGTSPLPPGLVTPALATANIADVAAVGRAVAAAAAQLGGRVRRAALVIPDTVAKVSLLRFDTVPPREADLLELIRWQMRKSAPFPIEQGIVSFTPGSRPPEGGQEFIVSIARTDIVEQYEAACAQAGIHAGLVDLSTFSIINGVLASGGSPAGDWLLVHATPTYATVAVVRGADVIFFRNRAEETEGTLADIVHQTAMYYEDRLQGAGFTRVLLVGASTGAEGTEALRRSLEDRLRVSIEAVDPRLAASLTDRIAAAPELLDTLAPLVGILVRERRAA
jgi:type IV pilus assembly protein PilM